MKGGDLPLLLSNGETSGVLDQCWGPQHKKDRSESSKSHSEIVAHATQGDVKRPWTVQLVKQKALRHLFSVYKYLMEWSNEDAIYLFSVMTSYRTRANGYKLKIKKTQSKLFFFFNFEESKALVHVAQTVCV